MDFLCRLLSADLYCLVNSVRKNAAKDSSKKQKQEKNNNFLVVRPSYTIRHEYPGPLKTYDGEELCESRWIRLSDVTPSQVDLILSMCEEEQDEMEQKCEPEEEESTGEINVKEEKLCNSVVSEEDLNKFESQMSINQKSSITLESIYSENPPTPQQLIRTELRARTLYEVATCQNPSAPTWDCLEATEKLSFHWQAHTGIKLQETPFENFQQCYLKNRRKNGPKMGIREIRSEMKQRWCNMDRSERMPFIVMSLLYEVSVGAIDPRIQCEVREFFMKVK